MVLPILGMAPSRRFAKKSLQSSIRLQPFGGSVKTVVSSTSQEVTIEAGAPTVIIGERINPTGRKSLAGALLVGDLGVVSDDARKQVEAGADIIDVNVGAAGVDEVEMLPQAVKAVTATVDAPVCIDTANPEALEAALTVYKGKALVNSVTGEEASLSQVLPLVREHGAAVIGLLTDDSGIPDTAEGRLAVAQKILDRATAEGISGEDVIFDCVALTLGADQSAGVVTLEAIEKVATELGNNVTLGASNISFGLPCRDQLNQVFLGLAIRAGLTCAIVNPEKSRGAIAAADLILGQDEWAARYIQCMRSIGLA
jgi:5-methyltetrahydrofolate--homocysteine methyltransferase